MSAYLEIEGEKGPTRIALEGIVTLGRDALSSIRLHDPAASRNHALIRTVHGTQFYLMDLGSRNGTFVNGKRVHAPTQLRDGDVVSVGKTGLNFSQDHPPSLADSDSESDAATTRAFCRTRIAPVTVLVCDIRGYTALSERIEVSQLSRVMSYWFGSVQQLIEDHGGEVDQFLGDCVLAIWDCSDEPAERVRQTLAAACKLADLTAGLRDHFPFLPEAIRVGIGIHSGMAALSMGAENSVMGDTVSTTFRLEEATKSRGRDAIVSRDTWTQLRDCPWEGEELELEVRGRSAPVPVRALSLDELRRVLAGAAKP